MIVEVEEGQDLETITGGLVEEVDLQEKEEDLDQDRIVTHMTPGIDGIVIEEEMVDQVVTETEEEK